MIKHIVMWRLMEEAEGNTAEVNGTMIKEAIESLRGEIPGIVEIEVGIDWNRSEAAYDVALYSVFNSKEDLDNYQVHPKHVEAAGFIRKVTNSRVVVDYTV